jgi:hypothetical protein
MHRIDVNCGPLQFFIDNRGINFFHLQDIFVNKFQNRCINNENSKKNAKSPFAFVKIAK